MTAAPEADARGGVAAVRFADDVARAAAPEAGGGLGDVRLAGDDPRAFRRHLRRDAVDGALEQRAVAAEREELLGPLLRGSAARTASRRRRP